jgi:hypothetical protein
VKTLQFIALVLSAVALIPLGAHLFALPNKLHLAVTDYFVVQNIYRGWALFGFVLFANLFALAALATVVRMQTVPFALVLLSFCCQVASLAVFFTFVFPANQATDNWTAIPGNWELLRQNWEYGHAASAALSFIGFCTLAGAVLITQQHTTA